MTIKVQIFFQSTAQGWTETYYNGSTDPQGFITDFSTGQPSQGDGGALCARRRSILAAQSSITGARAALEGEQRQAASIEFAYNTFNGLYSFSIGAEQAEIYSSLLCRLNTTGLVIHQKNLYLGGLPEDIVGDTGAYTPGHAVGPWTAVMKVFIKLLTSGTWQIKSRPGTAGGGTQSVSSFTVNPTGETALVIPNVVPGAAGSVGFVIVRGLKYPNGWNGVHRATSITTVGPGQMVLGPTRRSYVSLPVWDTNSGGLLTPFTPSYNPIKQFTDIRLVEHKRGRAFFQFRGRRSRV